MSMAEALTVSVTVAREWRKLYDAFHAPEAFAGWASGLSKVHLHRDGDTWVGDGAEGPIRVRFTPQNDFGVMDHWVDTGADALVYIPLRVLQNGDGAEVVLTLFRQPGMDDAKFAEDQVWVKRDLQKLKAVAEAG